MSITTDLEILGNFLVLELKKELASQGRNVTSQLSKSIRSEVRKTLTGFSLQVSYEEHGIFLNQGRKAGGKRVPISALTEWIKRRGFASKATEVKSIAFAIQTKIFKEGIKPSKWQDNVLKANRLVIIRSVTKSIKDDFDLILKDIANNINRKLATG